MSETRLYDLARSKPNDDAAIDFCGKDHPPRPQSFELLTQTAPALGKAGAGSSMLPVTGGGRKREVNSPASAAFLTDRLKAALRKQRTPQPVTHISTSPF